MRRPPRAPTTGAAGGDRSPAAPDIATAAIGHRAAQRPHSERTATAPAAPAAPAAPTVITLAVRLASQVQLRLRLHLAVFFVV